MHCRRQLLHSRIPVRAMTKSLTRLSPVAAALMLCACTGDAYHRSADRQALGLLYSREAGVLGYRPQVEVGPPGPPDRPDADAYRRVPDTPVPPEVASPIEPAGDEPFGPQGPPLGGAAVPGGPLNATAADDA